MEEIKELDDLLERLNDMQLDAVKHCDTPLLILAGAGTGKTSVVITKIAYLIFQKNIKPWNILAVTFTNKAAKEMEERLSKIVQLSGIWMGTFHSICSKLMRYHGENLGYRKDFIIIDEDDQVRLVKSILEGLNIDIKKTQPKNILSIINTWKDKSIEPHELNKNYLERYSEKIACDVYKTYQDRLKASNSMDFGDLILNTIILFRKHPEILEEYQDKFEYILVDEYQDTNMSQDLLIRMLASKNKKICCVGDDDQSIYGWRGAEVDNILNFPRSFPNTKIIRLEQNYRSTQNILAIASSIIANNKGRLGKSLWSKGGVGEKVYIASVFDNREEAELTAKIIKHLLYNGYAYKDVAILVRAGFQTRSFEESFLQYSINYRVVGGQKFYDRLEIRDSLAYIRVAVNHSDSLAFERIINVPKRGIGETTVMEIANFASLHGMSAFQAAEIMIREKILSPKTAKTLGDLLNNFRKWNNDFVAGNKKHFEVVQDILTQSGYIDMWKNSKQENVKSRIENLNELFNAIQTYPDIGSFLEHISLVMDNQENADSEQSYVSILTMHGAKGLEFPVVFLPGWEDEIFPSIRSGSADQELEEERRLAYVAVTRAKQKLFISHAKRRQIYGNWQSSNPSMFLGEIPLSLCEPITSYNFLHKINLNGSANITSLSSAPKKTVVNTTVAEFKEKSSRVFHQKFGYGNVISDRDGFLEVVFDQAGLKKIKKDFLTETN